MAKPFDVVRQFEAELCAYTGARYAVSVTSCTAALLLAVAYWVQKESKLKRRVIFSDFGRVHRRNVCIPKRTYVSVPMSIIHAGAMPVFRDEDWIGEYRLDPTPVWDSARLFTSGMHRPGRFQCVSFHWSKTLGIQQGGAILHDDAEADPWLRRARFDGRTEGLAPKDDDFRQIGWHFYLSPETAAAGLMRLSLLPTHNPPLPNDPYPDLSQMEIFR
jgi:dTDP-4-amino-4,6-dideoxygalactose transaminase